MNVLEKLTTLEFIEASGSLSPTPGGGSVIATTAAMACSLGIKTANFTIGKKKYKENEETVIDIRNELEALQNDFINLVDKDIESYNEVSKAYKMDKSDKNKAEALSLAYNNSALTLLSMMNKGANAIILMTKLKDICNPNLLTDVVAGNHILQGIILAAYQMMLENAHNSVEKESYNICTEGNNLIIKLIEQNYLEVYKNGSNI